MESRVLDYSNSLGARRIYSKRTVIYKFRHPLPSKADLPFMRGGGVDGPSLEMPASVVCTPLGLRTFSCPAAYQKGTSTKPFVVLASSWLSTW